MTASLTMKLAYLGLTALAVALEVTGDIFFKKWI